MTDRPTHWHEASQSAVYPQGYPEEELTLLADDFWVAPDRAEAVRKIKAEASRRILERYPQWKQINAAFDLDAPWVAEMRDFINEVRGWSNNEEAKL
jgi:hypothetical protein